MFRKDLLGGIKQLEMLEQMKSIIVLLLHHIIAFIRTILGDFNCLLRAEEVGLGKIIEAGFVKRELKLLDQ